MMCPNCGHRMTGIQYPLTDMHHYDGVSEWMCMYEGCDHVRVGRFCGKELKDNEFEKPFCTGEKPHARHSKIG